MPVVVNERPLENVFGRFQWADLDVYATQGSAPQRVQLNTGLSRQETESFRTSVPGGFRDPYDLIRENNRRNTRPFDTGHEFRTYKLRPNNVLSHKHMVIPRFGNRGPVMGPLIPEWTSTSPDNQLWFRGTLNQSSWNDLSKKVGLIDKRRGTKFLAASRPTKSVGNLNQLLLETIQKLPTIPFNTIERAMSFKDLAKATGSEYLNVRFAIEPAIRDIITICEAVVQSRDIIDAYLKDSGKPVRRRRGSPWETTLLEEKTLNNQYLQGLRPNVVGGLFRTTGDSRGTVTVQRRVTERYSFSASYMYFLDEGSTFVSKIRKFGQLADKLLGVKLDLDLLWELTPWSWFIDYFGTIGDLLSLNEELANDSLVLRYGYLMREVVATEVLSHEGVNFDSIGHTGVISSQHLFHSKERIRANPYGFEIAPSDLSVGQWAILGALGLSMAPGQAMYGRT